MPRKYDIVHSSRAAPDVTRAASRWLRRNLERPFFLWTHYFDPHAPYDLHKEFADLASSGHERQGPEPINAKMAGRIGKYDSEIAFTDFNVGKLLDVIDGLGLRDSTLVVLTADHGEGLGEHGYVGHGRRLDEGNERLPARPMRYVSFAGRKGFAPGWMSWVWARPSDLPLRLGCTTGAEKFVWTPDEGTLAMIDLEQDPFEQQPTLLAEGDRRYEKETAALRRWFKSTDLEESELKVSGRDTEVLKNLGYLQ